MPLRINMYNKTKNIEQEVEKTLQCFQQLKPLEHNPFFYTRIKARLEDESSKNIILRSVPVLQPIMILLLAIVNFGFAFLILGNENNSTQYIAISELATEYSLEESINDPFDTNEQE